MTEQQVNQPSSQIKEIIFMVEEDNVGCICRVVLRQANVKCNG